MYYVFDHVSGLQLVVIICCVEIIVSYVSDVPLGGF